MKYAYTSFVALTVLACGVSELTQFESTEERVASQVVSQSVEQPEQPRFRATLARWDG